MMNSRSKSPFIKPERNSSGICRRNFQTMPASVSMDRHEGYSTVTARRTRILPDALPAFPAEGCMGQIVCWLAACRTGRGVEEIDKTGNYA